MHCTPYNSTGTIVLFLNTIDVLVYITIYHCSIVVLIALDGWIKSKFEKTSEGMPTYLVAFGIADYSFEDAIANGSKALTPNM